MIYGPIPLVEVIYAEIEKFYKCEKGSIEIYTCECSYDALKNGHFPSLIFEFDSTHEFQLDPKDYIIRIGG